MAKQTKNDYVKIILGNKKMNNLKVIKKIAYTACTILLASFLLGSGYPQKKGAEQDSPNFVFIFIDDMGWRDVGFMGSEYYETPNIDKLASEGMIFTNAYANAANCTPSRACLLTGQYSSRHGVYTVGSSTRGDSKDYRLIPIENTKILATEHITIAEAIKTAGYVSASMGKWHMGDPPTHGPREQGFDINIGGYRAGVPKGGYFVPYDNPYLLDGPEEEYLTDRLTDEALAFIENNSDKKFFLYLTHYAIHSPIEAKSELIEKYKEKEGSNGQDNATYAAMIESVDESVGRVMEKLDELQLAENTVVIFFSDNGGSMNYTDMAPLRGAKGMFYEGGIREPMIARWSGVISPNTQCDVPVISIDFFPTFLDIAGIEKPDDKILDGVSLLPLMNGENNLARESIFWHFPAYLQRGYSDEYESRDGLYRTRPVSVIRKGDWKLLMYHEEWVLDGGREKIDSNNAIELYNLADDLSETNNLANDNKSKRDELLDDLFAWMEETGSPLPTEANPDYFFMPDNIIDDGNPALLYTGSWSSATISKCYNKTVKRTKYNGDTVELSFSGTGIKLYTFNAPNLGQFKIFIDGEYKETIETACDTLEYQALAYEIMSLDTGKTHRIKLEVTDLLKDCYVDYFEIIDGVVVGSKDENIEPTSFELHQNYPNPFNNSTAIKFSIPFNSFTTLKIFDILGKEIRTLISKELKSGNHQVNFDASNLSSGLYIYQLYSRNNTISKKLVLLK